MKQRRRKIHWWPGEDQWVATRKIKYHRPDHPNDHKDCCGQRCMVCYVHWPCPVSYQAPKPHPPVKSNARPHRKRK